jgi:hypothetical protein
MENGTGHDLFLMFRLDHTLDFSIRILVDGSEVGWNFRGGEGIGWMKSLYSRSPRDISYRFFCVWNFHLEG